MLQVNTFLNHYDKIFNIIEKLILANRCRQKFNFLKT